MRKLSNHIYRPICLILALAGSLSASATLLRPVALAQAPVTNPSWSATGSLSTTRYLHTATLLRDGKALVVGGGGWVCSGNYPLPPYSCSATVNGSAEVYDSATGTWHSAGSLSPRGAHSATLLANGQVLVAGGVNWLLTGISGYLMSAEVYDPATGKWRPTGSFSAIRGDNTATLLPNGKVLAVGISNYNRPVVYSAEVYDPATEMWSVTGAPTSFTIFGSLTLLPNGKALAVAGNVAELYDPTTEKWSSAGNLSVINSAVTATLLRNGKVLVTGRREPAYTMAAELYDPGAGTWSVTGTPNTDGRTTLLADGRVLLTGGFDNDFLTGRNAEVYDPVAGTWSPAGNLITARQSHTATLLANGKLLVAGGVDGDFDIGTKFHSSAEVFDPGLPQAGTVASVSAASFSLTGLASEALTASFGAGLATTAQMAASLPLPTSLAGTTVKVKDSAGIERFAPLFFVSPTQVNYQIPPGTTAGVATVTITSGDGAVSTGLALIKVVAPSLFAANADGQGVVAALALRIKADGTQSYEPVAQFDAAQNRFVARPLDLGPETDQVYLALFGTGIRQRSSLSAVIATVGGAYAEVSFAGAQGAFTGLDQINVRVPRSLSGRGEVEVLLTVEAQMANPVRINVKKADELFFDPASFSRVISDLGTPVVVDFNEIDAPTGDTYLGRNQFNGSHYAELGIRFANPNGYPLYIAPGGTCWNQSNSLSIGRFPFDENPDSTDEDDDLLVVFTTPQLAAGFTLVDATASDEQFVQFLDANREVIIQTRLPTEYAPYRRFIGLVATSRPIAAINIVDAPADGDDITYDDFIFVP